jgi:hypothetical protein
MSLKNRLRPLLEVLEDRTVPATIRVVAGSLFVSQQVGPLTVQSTAVNGQFKVTDNAKTVTVSGVGNLISITGTNLGNKINFQANTDAGNKAFNGNLLINSGNGADIINIGGRVGGNATLLTGLGADTVTSNGSDVSIGGGLNWVDITGKNTFDLNDRNYTIGTNLTLTGVGVFDMGAGNTLKVGGSATLRANPTTAVPMTVQFNGADVDVFGSLQVTGGVLDDTVTVTSMLNIGGNMSLNLNGGDNTFDLTPAAGGTGVNGSLNYQGGVGVDVIVVGADSAVGGNARFDLGNGINTFADAATSLFAGDLSLFGSNDTNTHIVSGMVGGSLNVTLGNGDGNTTVVTGFVGGTLRYRLGNGSLGVLTVDPTEETVVQIDAVFGTGDSTFTLGPNVILNGTVRGTGGTYTFNQGGAVLLPMLFFLNYP